MDKSETMVDIYDRMGKLLVIDKKVYIYTYICTCLWRFEEQERELDKFWSKEGDVISYWTKLRFGAGAAKKIISSSYNQDQEKDRAWYILSGGQSL